MPLQYTVGLLSIIFLFFYFPSISYIKSTNALTVHIWFIESLLSLFFFFSSLNSSYSANLVCSIGTVVTMLWFQPLHCCCFLFFLFFSLLFRGKMLMHPLNFQLLAKRPPQLFYWPIYSLYYSQLPNQ